MRKLTQKQDIFENPQFFIEGATASDVRQGKEGDCWFMSALCTLSNKEGLLESVCVARDEKVGVYGFVFHRGMFLHVDGTNSEANSYRWRMDIRSY